MNLDVSALDPGDKPTDIGDERARRNHALEALRGALAAEERAVREASAATEAAASTAMWLGASLADLAVVTGRTRQAARKRWPTLGAVYRKRLWLGNHVDDIRWAAAVVIDNRAGIELPDPGMFDELRALDARVGAEFDADATASGDDAAARWYALDRMVDVVLRGITQNGVTTDEQAEFAVHGAVGVVGYFDHASGEAESAAS